MSVTVVYNLEIVIDVAQYNKNHLTQKMKVEFLRKLDLIIFNPFMYPQYHFLKRKTIRYFMVGTYIYLYKVDIENKKIIVYYSYSSKQNIKKVRML